MGLAFTPDLALLFDGDHWQMSAADRAFLLTVARGLAPNIAVEVGTLDGGSLTALAPACGRVVTVDHDPHAAKAADGWGNVEAVTGDSGDVLPGLLDGLQPGLVLIDAAHDYDGVTAELAAIVKWEPTQPAAVLVHDTSLDEVHQAFADTDWAGSQHVYVADATIVTGRAGGGFGWVWLQPDLRPGAPFLRL